MSAEYLDSAFPLDNDRGMTLRDWFAGQALMGAEANGGSGSVQMAAEYAYAIADAMLAERAKS